MTLQGISNGFEYLTSIVDGRKESQMLKPRSLYRHRKEADEYLGQGHCHKLSYSSRRRVVVSRGSPELQLKSIQTLGLMIPRCHRIYGEASADETHVKEEFTHKLALLEKQSGNS